ncbi:MAG: acyl-CoA dehydratase activase-related protein [Desulfotomaculaceae bacterium]|nr:acyl-CoA dehydratase activase-related protein [Desulfotomaculaceae bacterium]
MPLKVGIPRALLYYYYYPMWRVFFQELGAEVVLSQPSNKGLLATGLKHAVDEVCLPVKLAYGHVLDLAGKSDLIFLPRLVSIGRREYICPKFLGFPDMIRRIKGVPKLIDPNINLYKSRMELYRVVHEVGKLFSCSCYKIGMAYMRSVKVHNQYLKLLRLGLMPAEAMAIVEDRVENLPVPEAVDSFKVALIGHPYNIYDTYVNMNVIKRLKEMGASIMTAEFLPEQVVNNSAARCLPKKLFWTLGQRMAGAAFNYMERSDVAGIVHIAAFGCGPDSMTGELIERSARLNGVPFLNITLDEHTGEAGLLTRLEAFMDMLRWRKAGPAWV